RVARRDREGLLLAAAADQDRNAVAITRFGQCRFGAIPLAGECRSLTLDHRVEDLQRFLHPVESLGEGAELEAELAMFEFEPAGPDAEDCAARAGHVQC